MSRCFVARYIKSVQRCRTVRTVLPNLKVAVVIALVQQDLGKFSNVYLALALRLSLDSKIRLLYLLQRTAAGM